MSKNGSLVHFKTFLGVLKWREKGMRTLVILMVGCSEPLYVVVLIICIDLANTSAGEFQTNDSSN